MRPKKTVISAPLKQLRRVLMQEIQSVEGE